MRRSAYALSILVACLAMASAAPAASPPVLGKKGLMPYGTGCWRAHPRDTFIDGAPSASVGSITCRH